MPALCQLQISTRDVQDPSRGSIIVKPHPSFCPVHSHIISALLSPFGPSPPGMTEEMGQSPGKPSHPGLCLDMTDANPSLPWVVGSTWYVQHSAPHLTSLMQFYPPGPHSLSSEPGQHQKEQKQLSFGAYFPTLVFWTRSRHKPVIKRNWSYSTGVRARLNGNKPSSDPLARKPQFKSASG